VRRPLSTVAPTPRTKEHGTRLMLFGSACIPLVDSVPDDTPVCPFRALWSLRRPASGQNNALTCGKTGQGIVEVAGIPELLLRPTKWA
jgi:hypothetical protein